MKKELVSRQLVKLLRRGSITLWDNLSMSTGMERKFQQRSLPYTVSFNPVFSMLSRISVIFLCTLPTRKLTILPLRTRFVDDEQVLTQKDNEWCKANYPGEYLAVTNKQQSASEEDTSEPPRKKVARKKVS